MAFRLLPAALAIAPPLVVLQAVLHYGRNVPFWDQWDFAGTVVAVVEGRLDVAALWAQHNEHRPVLARAVMLLLARLTGWDVRAEMVAGVAVEAATAAFLVALVQRTVGPHAPRVARWLWPLVTALVFSLAQYENWTWGWQLSLHLNVAATAAAVFALTRFGPGPRGAVPAAAAGVAAALSFASGLVLLVLLPPAALLARAEASRPARLRGVAILAVCGAATVACYLHGYVSPTHPTSPRVAEAPLASAAYVLAYLGAGFAGDRLPLAVAWGAAGVAAFVALVARGRHGGDPRALDPWLLLAVYVVATGVVTSGGRVGFGVEQALSARYVAVTALFWVALVATAALVLAPAPADATASPTHGRGLVAGASIAAALLAAGWAFAQGHARAQLRTHRDAMRAVQRCLLSVERAPDRCLARAHPDPGTVRAAARVMQRLHLGPYRDLPDPGRVAPSRTGPPPYEPSTPRAHGVT